MEGATSINRIICIMVVVDVCSCNKNEIDLNYLFLCPHRRRSRECGRAAARAAMLERRSCAAAASSAAAAAGHRRRASPMLAHPSLFKLEINKNMCVTNTFSKTALVEVRKVLCLETLT